MARNGDGDQVQATVLADYLAPALAHLHWTQAPSSNVGVREELIRSLRADAAARMELWRLYAGEQDAAETDDLVVLAPPSERPGPAAQRSWVMRILLSPVWVATATLVTTLLLYAVFWRRAEWRLDALLTFSVVLLTLLPGFFYLRFLRYRLQPVYAEYVYNLHRLGVDRPRYLPEPPRVSLAHDRWFWDGGSVRSVQGDSIYAVKFRTQYGHLPASDQDRYQAQLGNLTALYLCTAVLGAGWAAVLWSLTVPPPTALFDAMRFGFLGAYFYVLSMLTRRFFQNDLRPGAYLGAIVRVVSVLLLVAAVDQAWRTGIVGGHVGQPWENCFAFVVGVFPTVAMQLLRKIVSKVTGFFRGGLEPPFPLSQLDGMDIWTEARLLELGVEDVQHLARANFVDLCLATRIPAHRLVDWVDQALLLVQAGLPGLANLEPPKEGAPDPTTYRELRLCGIRSASDLRALMRELGVRLRSSPDRNPAWPSKEDAALGPLTESHDGRPSLLTRAAIIELALRDDPNLRLIDNWHRYEQPPIRA